MTDTHKLRAFAAYLAGDGYTDEHVRMIEDAADEIERLKVAQSEIQGIEGVDTDEMREWADKCHAAKQYRTAALLGYAADEIERLRARDETLRRYEHLDATQWAYLPVATVAKAEG